MDNKTLGEKIKTIADLMADEIEAYTEYVEAGEEYKEDKEFYNLCMELAGVEHKHYEMLKAELEKCITRHKGNITQQVEQNSRYRR